MTSGEAAFGCHVHVITAEARRNFLSTFQAVLDEEEASQSSIDASPPSIGASASSESDDEDEEMPLPPPPPQHMVPPPQVVVPVEQASVVGCLLCAEELPFIADTTTRGMMASQFSNLRQVIFKFQNMLNGDAHDDIIFYSMLQMRRSLIENHLEAYSMDRIKRWTLPMLREHYHPVRGHRFDYIRSISYLIAELYEMDHKIKRDAMYVDNAEVGQRQFNLNAVDRRLRGIRELSLLLKSKKDALKEKKLESPSDASLVIDTIFLSSTMLPTQRARIIANDTVASMYDLSDM